MTNAKSRSSIIAERLRVAREMAGLTQAQVADILGLHRPAISEMEAGRRKVSGEELGKLSEVYGVAVDWITQTESNLCIKDSVRVELAARELVKLNSEDLDRVLQLLVALRQREDET